MGMWELGESPFDFGMVFFTFGLPIQLFVRGKGTFFLFDGCELRTSNMSYEAKKTPPPQKGKNGRNTNFFAAELWSHKKALSFSLSSLYPKSFVAIAGVLLHYRHRMWTNQ